LRTFGTFFDSIQGESNYKGAAFERAVKRWFQGDDEWRGFFDEVYLWNEWPLADTRDLGIDLVARDKTSRFWAIQVKAYDPDSALKKSDVNSFISASSRPIFAGRILVTTTKSLGPNLRATLSDQEKETRVITWADLETSEFDWLGSSTAVKPPKTLWKHQERAVEDVVEQLPTARRGQLVMACGTGKTLTSIRISEHLNSQLTVVVVPSISLISQAISDWSRDSSEPISWWAVCSDETVGTNAEAEKFHAFDLAKPSSTDESSLSRFLQVEGRRVVFSTYHSSGIVARALVSSGAVADLVIFDEAHRLAGHVSDKFTSLLDDDLPIQMRLFQTATPRLFKRYNLNSDRENTALSMDDKEVFGEVLYKYSFGAAIRDGKLRDFKVVVFVVTDTELNKEIIDRDLLRIGEKVIDYKDLATNYGVIQAMLKHDLRSTITFHSRVKWASDFSATQKALWGQVSATDRAFESLTITGEDSAAQRKSRLAALETANESKFVQVTNARCLSEGVDVPDLDAVVFVDPKASKVDITQAVGRAIRKGSGKRDFGYVVIPIFLSELQVSEGSLEPAQFAATLDVLNSLKSHDEDFETLLVRTRLGRVAYSNRNSVIPKVIIDSAKPLPSHFFEEIQTAILEGVTSRWYGQFLALKALANNGLNIRADFGRSKPHKSLHGWAGTQRIAYRRGTLSSERAELLEEIPNWFWDDRQVFDQGFAEFLRYLESGGALLPSTEVDNVAGGGKMRTFARRVLKSYLGPVSKSELSKEQHETLSGIEAWRDFTSTITSHSFKIHHCDGVVYEILVPPAPPNAWRESWRAMLRYLNALQKYSQDTGHTCFPESQGGKRFSYDGVGISSYRYKIEKQDDLPDYVRAVLDQLPTGDSCRAPKPASLEVELREPQDPWNDSLWEKSFSAFSAYFLETGISAPPFGTMWDGINIQGWIATQRGIYTGTFKNHENLVSESRKLRIESLPGFTWTVPEGQSGGFRKWQRIFVLVSNFEAEYGHTRFRQREEPSLYSWSRNQKLQYKEGTLSETKIRLLEGLKSWEW
jgi:superfamily II DNA or RNA helicase